MKDKRTKTDAKNASSEEPRQSISEEVNSEDLEKCLETVQQLTLEKDDYYDSLLRKQAEFENYRRRVNKEKGDVRLSSVADVIGEILPVIDSCEKGLASLPEAADDERLSAYRQGLELMLAGLQGVLSRFDVSEVPGEGSPFDPTVHEAVLTELVEEGEDGMILEEFRKGYRVGDRLIRASQVKVSVKAEETSRP